MKKRGFTIIELLVIISIIGLISSVALANLQGSREKAKIAAAQIFRGNVNSLLGAGTAASWNFNEGTLGNPVSTVTDNSGNNLNGTVIIPPGGNATYAQGVNNIGMGVLLTGGAYITGNGISSTGGRSVTVTSWIKPLSSTANVRRIFEVGLDACSSFRMGIDSANIMIGNEIDEIDNGDSDTVSTPQNNLYAAPGPLFVSNPAPISNNKWQFIVVSFDANGEARTYLDGVLASTITGLPTTECSPVEAATWSIGGIAPGMGPEYTYYNGTVDDVVIYEGSLGPQAISKLYQEGLAKYSVALQQD